jgi:DNA helicase-2/ATP-dependent DNA helicase PcrA
MEEQTILDSLNKDQREAAEATEGPVLILAGAGSGKTRVLVHRIAYLIDEKGVNPGSILAITFTNKAADEMRSRVDQMIPFGSREVWVSTFHSLCVRILRRNADRIGYTRSFTIYDTEDQLTVMKNIFRERNIDSKKIREKAVLNRISSAKDELIGPKEYRVKGRDRMSDEIGPLYEAYQEQLITNNAMDFDDLIMNTVLLFQKNPDVLEYYQERFRYLMVDEYQDTNTAQFQFISFLAKKYRNLCVVGDDDQSIYKFRGANIRNILDFESFFPDAHVVKLEQNYRSTQNILDAANEVIRHNHGRKSKKLWTENDAGDKVRLRKFFTGFDEAQFVADDIGKMVRDYEYEYRDCAVLYRTNAQSRLFEEKFLLANIPYKIVGGVNFYARKEIKDILAYLKTINNGVDDLAVERIINIPKRGIGAVTIRKLKDYSISRGISLFDAACEAEHMPGIAARTRNKITSFTDTIGVMRAKAGESKISELLKFVVDETGYAAELKANHDEESDARIENIDELISKAVQYESEEEEPTLNGFLEQVALIADIDTVEDDDNKVLLMTLHSAKGLEFPVVYMTGMEEGLFPSAMSINSEFPEDEIEEERRLAYVGMTRAKKLLTLTYAQERMVRGDVVMNPISRFVREIPRELIDAGYEEQPKTSGRDILAGSFGGLSFGKKFPTGKSYSQQSFGTQPERSSVTYKKKKSPYTNVYTAPKKKSSSKALPDYQVGDTIHHVKFGDGTVKAIEDKGRDYLVTVDFPAWGVKKMFAAFANLQKV